MSKKEWLNSMAGHDNVFQPQSNPERASADYSLYSRHFFIKLLIPLFTFYFEYHIFRHRALKSGFLTDYQGYTLVASLTSRAIHVEDLQKGPLLLVPGHLFWICILAVPRCNHKRSMRLVAGASLCGAAFLPSPAEVV